MISAIQARKPNLNHDLSETASVKSVPSVFQWFSGGDWTTEALMDVKPLN